MQAVASSRAGYSDHLNAAHIVSVYSFLAAELPPSDAVDLGRAQEVLLAIGLIADDFAIGKSRVFLRQGVLAELERRRMEFIGAYAARVQAVMRGLAARSQFRKVREQDPPIPAGCASRIPRFRRVCE